MSKETLYRYTCNRCHTEVIAKEVPRGWVRLLSRSSRSSSGGLRIDHHRNAPALWTPALSAELPEDAYWCSPECLSAWVLDKARDLVELAKVKR